MLRPWLAPPLGLRDTPPSPGHPYRLSPTFVTMTRPHQLEHIPRVPSGYTPHASTAVPDPPAGRSWEKLVRYQGNVILVTSCSHQGKPIYCVLIRTALKLKPTECILVCPPGSSRDSAAPVPCASGLRHPLVCNRNPKGRPSAGRTALRAMPAPGRGDRCPARPSDPCACSLPVAPAAPPAPPPAAARGHEGRGGRRERTGAAWPGRPARAPAVWRAVPAARAAQRVPRAAGRPPCGGPSPQAPGGHPEPTSYAQASRSFPGLPSGAPAVRAASCAASPRPWVRRSPRWGGTYRWPRRAVFAHAPRSQRPPPGPPRRLSASPRGPPGPECVLRPSGGRKGKEEPWRERGKGRKWNTHGEKFNLNSWDNIIS